jgi:hypothetical protein
VAGVYFAASGNGIKEPDMSGSWPSTDIFLRFLEIEPNNFVAGMFVSFAGGIQTEKYMERHYFSFSLQQCAAGCFDSGNYWI